LNEVGAGFKRDAWKDGEWWRILRKLTNDFELTFSLLLVGIVVVAPHQEAFLGQREIVVERGENFVEETAGMLELNDYPLD
jgi:hypothetical protein